MKQIPDVLLGFEVGTGREVHVPVRNMVVCGQTQEAGKTTALEALIARSELRAVTFVTKRGEGSFTGGRRIEPYFREQADWQFVSSILEASRGEKLKWERAAIITAAKGCRRLADVHRNIREALSGKKSTRWEKEYICLDAYLDVVVPEIDRVRWAPRLELAAGVNVVDVTALPVEMQHLVIKSSLDWVLAHEEKTVVVIPEAWKFLPEGRKTPVQHAAIALIRQGSGLRNYVWLDSQDIGGVDKEVLRSCPVWVLGVQREANELKRTLDNIPDGIAKPSKADIATLELGQFYACWKANALKTYVLPAWLDAVDGRRIAKGLMPVQEAIDNRPRPSRRATQEDTVTDAEARALRQENEQLKTEHQQLKTENADLRRRLEALERKPDAATRRDDSVPARRAVAVVTGTGSGTDERRGAGRNRGESADAKTYTFEESMDDERRYQAFKARLIEEAATDPKLLRVIAAAPELEIHLKREVITADGTSGDGWIGRLIADGWFDEVKTGYSTFMELQRRGARLAKPSAYNWCNAMVAKGFLTAEGKEGYRVVAGMKVNIVEAA